MGKRFEAPMPNIKIPIIRMESTTILVRLIFTRFLPMQKIYGVDSVALIYPQFEKDLPAPMIVDLQDHLSKTKLIIGCIDIKKANIEKDSALLKRMMTLEL